MPTHRIEQLNELIKQKLGDIFLKEVELPKGCLMTITNVTTTHDLSQSKVLISILPGSEEEQILTVLNRRAGYFQFLLKGQLVIRRIPKLIFKSDISLQKTSKIDRLIDKIHKEK